VGQSWDHLIVGSRATGGRGSPALAGFHMSVVIFVVGPTASELDGAFSLCKMFQEVAIQKFRSIIRIEAKQGEG
jgi:hypothetical protein